jgi:flagellar basal body-associated protein FliL
MKAPGLGEIIFIVVMLLLTVLITAGCLYFFIRQYRKETREKEEQDRE